MLEERTFYFTETPMGEVLVGLADVGEVYSEAWQKERNERVKAILAREGVRVWRVLDVGTPGETACLVPVRVIVPALTQAEMLRHLLATPFPPPASPRAGVAQHADPGDDPDG